MINKPLVYTYLYLLMYILLSSGVILYNKVLICFPIWLLPLLVCVCTWLLWISVVQWVLSPKYFNFPFPITLTMIHMGFSGTVAFFLVRVFKVWLSFAGPWICVSVTLRIFCWLWVCFVLSSLLPVFVAYSGDGFLCRTIYLFCISRPIYVGSGHAFLCHWCQIHSY